MDAFLSALFLQTGYNTALVAIGAALLGGSAGAIGTFVLLRKRSLVSDAISHATLPGLCLAFIVMALATGDGRATYLPDLADAVTGLFSVDPAGALSPVARVRNPTSGSDPADGHHLGLRHGGNRPWLMFIDTDALRVYRKK